MPEPKSKKVAIAATMAPVQASLKVMSNQLYPVGSFFSDILVPTSNHKKIGTGGAAGVTLGTAIRYIVYPLQYSPGYSFFGLSAYLSVPFDVLATGAASLAASKAKSVKRAVAYTFFYSTVAGGAFASMFVEPKFIPLMYAVSAGLNAIAAIPNYLLLRELKKRWK